LTRLDCGCSTLVGITENQLNRLQSVLSATARLIYSARKFDHVSPLLGELHWLRIPQRTEFRLAIHAFRCLHGAAPQYLASDLMPVTDFKSPKRMRSGSTARLHPPTASLKTIGDRAFSIAASSIWNGLTLSSTLAIFRTALKTELFTRSFPA